MLGVTFALTAQIGTNAMAADLDGDVNAVVVTPVVITQTTPMNFGDISGGATAGTISMTTTGTRGSTGGSTFITASTNSPGIFTVTGVSGAAISVSATDTVATLESGTNTMGFVLAEPTYPATIAGGSVLVQFGGTLTVGISQAAGTYDTPTDTYSIQVNYQ